MRATSTYGAGTGSGLAIVISLKTATATRLRASTSRLLWRYGHVLCGLRGRRHLCGSAPRPVKSITVSRGRLTVAVLPQRSMPQPAEGSTGVVMGQDLRAAREAKRVSLGKLAERIGRYKGHLSRVERGINDRDVTPALVLDYERALGVEIETADHVAATAYSDSSGNVRGGPRDEASSRSSALDYDHSGDEEDETDRRDVLKLPVIAALAAETSRLIARADPDPLTLADIDDDADRFAAIYATTPHAELLPEVQRRWAQVDRALARRTSLAARDRLTSAAGRLSYFLARLGFNCGEFTTARRLAVLAEQYVWQAGDKVILSSVAGLRSSMAYYRGRYDLAVSVFKDYPPDPPYLVSRNAAYRARAHARLGDVAAAKTEFELMRRSQADRMTEPGDLPLSEEASWMFAAVTLSYCRDGEHAEPFARRSISAHEANASASPEEWAHALLALSSALLYRQHPVIEESATVAAQAVDMTDGYPTHTVIQRVEDLVADMSHYRSVLAVGALQERVIAARRPALPQGSQ